jgi:hypothetical protein
MTFAWIVATLATYAVGMAVLFAGLGAALNHAPPVLFGSVLGVLLGSLSGSAQAALLRRWIGCSWLWIATVRAWAVFRGLNLGGLLGRASSPGMKLLEGVIHGAIFGGLLGLGQVLVLRESIPSASWWFLASIVSWSFATALADTLKMPFHPCPWTRPLASFRQ